MERLRLGNIATVITKGTTPTTLGYDFVSDGINFVKIESIAENGDFLPEKFAHITSECDQKLSRSQLQLNDLLFSIAGAIGRTAIVTDDILPANTNQALAIIRVPEGVIDYSYLKYVLQSQTVVDQFEKRKQGVAQLNISLKDIGDFEIPIYGSGEQKIIVDVLDKVSNLISLRKQQLAKLDELVKSRFVEMFAGDVYPQVAFGDICHFLRNGANIKQTKGAGGYPITRIETLSNDVFNVDRLGYADITDLQRYENYILQKGDILISHINSVAYLGRAVQYKGQMNIPIIHGMNLLCARLREEYNPTYVEWYFRSPKAKDYIATITKKAVNQASITTTDLRLMPVPAPPIELQEQFAAFVEQTEKSKLKIQQSLDKLETLKKALMQEYFG